MATKKQLAALARGRAKLAKKRGTYKTPSKAEIAVLQAKIERINKQASRKIQELYRRMVPKFFKGRLKKG